MYLDYKQINLIPNNYNSRACSNYHCSHIAIYFWNYESLCYQCAIDRYDRHTFTCIICGCIYENIHFVNGSSSKEWMLCSICKVKYAKERSRVQSNNHRAKNLGLLADLSLLQWIKILKTNNFKCAYCKNNFNCMDHKIPISGGGGTTKDNVVPCCNSCNSKKGIKLHSVNFLISH